jgi:hypothetical protein
MTDTGSMMGGVNTTWSESNRYLYMGWAAASANTNYCFKYYPTVGSPHASVEFLNGVSCPTGYESINISNLNGAGTMYLGETEFGLYIGGVQPTIADSLYGYVYDAVGNDDSTACYYVHDVASFP